MRFNQRLTNPPTTIIAKGAYSTKVSQDFGQDCISNACQTAIEDKAINQI